ncbi:MAG: hypothetical protein ACT4N8_13180 [Sphingosinicella sp.]|uniref:hypothetical protein n=1 Tax=Sphingosinicella sp. TaxID=1917971 RepID=UPI004037F15C
MKGLMKLIALAFVVLGATPVEAQTRRVELSILGTPPQSIIAIKDGADTQIRLLRQGNSYVRQLSPGVYTFQLRYAEDGSRHVAPEWDIVTLRISIPPGSEPFVREIARSYPISCNMPELRRVAARSSSRGEAFDNALRARLMLRYQPEEHCRNLSDAVKEALGKRWQQLRAWDPNFVEIPS